MLGTLNNLTALDLPKGIGWVDVLSNYALAPFLTKLLVPGMAQNDVILEVRLCPFSRTDWSKQMTHGTTAFVACTKRQFSRLTIGETLDCIGWTDGLHPGNSQRTAPEREAQELKHT